MLRALPLKHDLRGGLLCEFAVKNEWKDMIHQTKVSKTHLGKSKEVETLRYLSLVVPLKKVGDEAVHKELGDRMERAATTVSSLEAEQESGSGPRCQDTILGDVDAQTRFETTSNQSNDLPFSRGYILGSGKDSMKLLELMELCITLSNMLHKNRKSDLVIQKK
ncbi:hypothetical protein Tco_1543165 [Tanacetum coccineum]